jgi:hypothetical protein
MGNMNVSRLRVSSVRCEKGVLDSPDFNEYVASIGEHPDHPHAGGLLDRGLSTRQLGGCVRTRARLIQVTLKAGWSPDARAWSSSPASREKVPTPQALHVRDSS